MNLETRQALESSIKHWEQNVSAEVPGAASTKGGDCALCRMFVLEEPPCCGCPVMAFTGEHDCGDSPFYAAQDALRAWRKAPDSAEAKRVWRAAAQDELDFLKALRPDK